MSRFYANNPLLQRDKTNSEMFDHPLGRVALGLRLKAKGKTRLSPLIFMTDPARIKDLPDQLAILPRGAAVIYRHFGKNNRNIEAQLIREVTLRRDQQLLIGGGDIELARAVKADGVHFSRDPNLVGPKQCRRDHPELIITMAGIKQGRYSTSLNCLDALFISSIFDSHSPSAGTPIGLSGLKTAVLELGVPVIALGGINNKTAPKLLGSGAAGLASVSGFKLRT